MNLQLEIERIFAGKAFARPLFYSHPGGLRFELSETGEMIERFLTAVSKATKICSDVFVDDAKLVACLRIHSGSNRFAHRPQIHALRSAGINLPRGCSIWSEMRDRDEWFCEKEPEFWVNVAFEAPATLLRALLWCALAKDFGVIEPKPKCAVYLFNLNKHAMVFPYDDRGMDVVGPNKDLLSQLYRQHHSWLLDHDRHAMDNTFA